MSQAITTTYGRTRYTAKCERGRASVPNMMNRSIDENHRAALLALLEKFRAEDEAKDGAGSCIWTRGEWIGGGIGKGSTTVWVHNFANHPDELVRFDDGPAIQALGATHGALNECLEQIDRQRAWPGDSGEMRDRLHAVSHAACQYLADHCGKGCHR